MAILHKGTHENSRYVGIIKHKISHKKRFDILLHEQMERLREKNKIQESPVPERPNATVGRKKRKKPRS